MAAPDDFSVRLAAGLRMNKPHALVKGNICSDHCQTPSIAYVNGHCVSAFLGSAMLPLHLELHSGNNAFVASKSFPPCLQSVRCGVGGDSGSHGNLSVGNLPGPGGRNFYLRHLTLVLGIAEVNSTLSTAPPWSPGLGSTGLGVRETERAIPVKTGTALR